MRNARLRASSAIPWAGCAGLCRRGRSAGDPSLGGTWRGAVDMGAKGSLLSAQTHCHYIDRQLVDMAAFNGLNPFVSKAVAVLLGHGLSRFPFFRDAR